MEHPEVISSAAPNASASSAVSSSASITAASRIQSGAPEVRRDSAAAALEPVSADSLRLRLDERSTSDLGPGPGPGSLSALSDLLAANASSTLGEVTDGTGVGMGLGLGPRHNLTALPPEQELAAGGVGAGTRSKAGSVRSGPGSHRGSISTPGRGASAGSSSGRQMGACPNPFSGPERSSTSVNGVQPTASSLTGLGPVPFPFSAPSDFGLTGTSTNVAASSTFEPRLGQSLEWRDYKASIELESVRVLRELERELRVSSPSMPAPIGMGMSPQIGRQLQAAQNDLLALRGASASGSFAYPSFDGAPVYAAGLPPAGGLVPHLEMGAGGGLGLAGTAGNERGVALRQRDAPDNKSVGSSKLSGQNVPSARDSGITANERSSTSTLVAEGSCFLEQVHTDFISVSIRLELCNRNKDFDAMCT